MKPDMPKWFYEYAAALKCIKYPVNACASWSIYHDVLFPEAEWGALDIGSLAMARPIDIKNLNDKQRTAYEEILRYKCVGIDLDAPLYHFTTFANLNEAVRRGGFILSQPRDWSVNWEDTAFKNLLNRDGTQDDIRRLANAYIKDSYGMCWTLDDGNENILEMVRRKHPNESIVLLSTTARKLLEVYIIDSISILSCSLVKIEYLSGNELRKKSVSPDDLQSADVGTDVHHDSISKTINKYAAQNEARLIVEDCLNYSRKTNISVTNHETGQDEVKLIKHVDLSSAINSIRVLPNDYMFLCK